MLQAIDWGSKANSMNCESRTLQRQGTSLKSSSLTRSLSRQVSSARTLSSEALLGMLAIGASDLDADSDLWQPHESGVHSPQGSGAQSPQGSGVQGSGVHPPQGSGVQGSGVQSPQGSGAQPPFSLRLLSPNRRKHSTYGSAGGLQSSLSAFPIDEDRPTSHGIDRFDSPESAQYIPQHSVALDSGSVVVVQGDDGAVQSVDHAQGPAHAGEPAHAGDPASPENGDPATPASPGSAALPIAKWVGAQAKVIEGAGQARAPRARRGSALHLQVRDALLS